MRFFSIDADGDIERHDTAEEARREAKAALQSCIDGGEVFEEAEYVAWGVFLGSVHVNVLHTHGPECRGPDECPEGVPMEYHSWAEYSIVDEPHPEVESLRAELAALRARVGTVLTKLQEMEAHHRQGARSPAHGEYSFERAEAYEHAIDLLKEALEAPGGEE
jgi:hypothetical protein